MVPSAGNPTVRRRELGSVLRSLRAEAGLTVEQVADRLGFSRSKMSRLENGQRGVNNMDIQRLCGLYKVDKEQRRRMTELAAEGKERAWWPSSLPYYDYVGLEAVAASISDYGLALVPGLLQTPDYARAVVRAAVPTRTPGIAEERVQVRMTRQRLLSTTTAPSFDAILDESVLHRVVGNPAVMLAQLRRLLEMSQLPTVSIRVVPYDAGVVPAGVNKFVILQFAAPYLTDIVLIEELTSHRYLEEPEDVETYRATFRALAGLAADPAASQAMIRAKTLAYEALI
jgi:transcriptional regulator with XRE-family HTH domain